MLIDVALTRTELERRELGESIVAVADVLRATTVAIKALSNGATAVLPQPDDAAARALYATLQEQGIPVLLCGEKEGFRRPGYDLGNSPLEYASSVVKGKTIVHLTTNGTRALAACSNAKGITITSFSNRSATAERLWNWDRNGDTSILLVSAGKEEQYCLEDTVCLGGIIAAMLEPPGKKVELTDAALTALDLFEIYRYRLLEMIERSSHGRYLKEIELEDDFPECVKLDTTDLVPEMRNGRIVIPS